MISRVLVTARGARDQLVDPICKWQSHVEDYRWLECEQNVDVYSIFYLIFAENFYVWGNIKQTKDLASYPLEIVSPPSYSVDKETYYM